MKEEKICGTCKYRDYIGCGFAQCSNVNSPKHNKEAKYYDTCNKWTELKMKGNQ